VLNGTKVLGSIVGTGVDLQEVFELHAAGKTHLVYERRKLEEVNTVIQEVESGQVKARLVFDLG
jgi:alcohol dehydrogenase, propanol-preferring